MDHYYVGFYTASELALLLNQRLPKISLWLRSSGMLAFTRRVGRYRLIPVELAGWLANNHGDRIRSENK